MQPSAMIQTLKSLKLHGMAQAVGELASQASPAYQGAEGILDSLLKAEVAEREVRSVNCARSIDAPIWPKSFPETLTVLMSLSPALLVTMFRIPAGLANPNISAFAPFRASIFSLFSVGTVMMFVIARPPFSR